MTERTKTRFIDYYNEIGVPNHDKKSLGGRTPDNCQYGDWLYRNNPIAFNVAYNEWLRELDNS